MKELMMDVLPTLAFPMKIILEVFSALALSSSLYALFCIGRGFDVLLGFGAKESLVCPSLLFLGLQFPIFNSI